MRVAVITGGGTGIGAAVAKRFAIDGMRVVLAGRREDLVKEIAASITSAGGSASFVKCDVTKSADVEALARTAGPVDVLVNNAGIAVRKTSFDITAED